MTFNMQDLIARKYPGLLEVAYTAHPLFEYEGRGCWREG